MTTFSDDFNRANGALGSNWQAVGTRNPLRVQGNQADANAVGECYSAVATGAGTFDADQWAEAAIAVFGANDLPGVCVRVDTASGTGYVAYMGTATSLRIATFTNTGAPTTLGSGIVVTAIAANDVLRLQVEGTTLTAYINGVSQGTRTDSTYATGQPGMYYLFGNNRTTKVDDFAASNLVVGPPATPYITLQFNPLP